MNLKDEFIKLYEALNPEMKAPLLFAMKILAAGTENKGETQITTNTAFENK